MVLEVDRSLKHSDLTALDTDLSLGVSSAFVVPQARPWDLHGAGSGAKCQLVQDWVPLRNLLYPLLHPTASTPAQACLWSLVFPLQLSIRCDFRGTFQNANLIVLLPGFKFFKGFPILVSTKF